MDIQTEKIELVKLLLNTDNETVIYSVKQILMHQYDFWNDLSDQQKKEIEAADEEIKRGETVDYGAFMANYRL